MRKKKSWIVSIIVFLAFLTYSPFVYAASEEILSLKGITTIAVLVEDLAPNIEGKGGLTSERIKTDIELKLRMAGIKVIPYSERFTIPGGPFLYLNLNIRSSSLQGTYHYNIHLSLAQRVNLEQNPAINVYAQTWYRGGVGICEEQTIHSVRDNIRDQVDNFINDYLSVNSKKGS